METAKKSSHNNFVSLPNRLYIFLILRTKMQKQEYKILCNFTLTTSFSYITWTLLIPNYVIYFSVYKPENTWFCLLAILQLSSINKNIFNHFNILLYFIKEVLFNVQVRAKLKKKKILFGLLQKHCQSIKEESSMQRILIPNYIHVNSISCTFRFHHS